MMPQTVRSIYFGFISDFALKIILGLQKQKLIIENGIAEFYYIFWVHIPN